MEAGDAAYVFFRFALLRFLFLFLFLLLVLLLSVLLFTLFFLLHATKLQSTTKWNDRRRNLTTCNGIAHNLTEPSKTWPWTWPAILKCKFLREFPPIYVTTKHKEDICNSFQVIIQTETHTSLLNEYGCIHEPLLNEYGCIQEPLLNEYGRIHDNWRALFQNSLSPLFEIMFGGLTELWKCIILSPLSTLSKSFAIQKWFSIVWYSSQIRKISTASDRHAQLRTILPRFYLYILFVHSTWPSLLRTWTTINTVSEIFVINSHTELS